jgi:predicted nucleotidyltransferase
MSAPATIETPHRPAWSPKVQAVIDDAVQRLTTEFQPEQIWLFGSYAWGEPDEHSDLDFYIVVPKTDERSLQRAQRAHRCLRGLGMAKDVIVATSEAARRFGNLRPSLTYKIFREGVKLHGH